MYSGDTTLTTTDCWSECALVPTVPVAAALVLVVPVAAALVLVVTVGVSSR